MTNNSLTTFLCLIRSAMTFTWPQNAFDRLGRKQCKNYLLKSGFNQTENQVNKFILVTSVRYRHGFLLMLYCNNQQIDRKTKTVQVLVNSVRCCSWDYK